MNPVSRRRLERRTALAVFCLLVLFSLLLNVAPWILPGGGAGGP
ncbi:MAG TPA: hypothetical protein P5141_11165 [Candidatus Hydrogenedentes bacterium]|nr:hypothetical protein [Candidatus Hydrogenedentota bacterium]HOH51945.1 hypothetical protein [Candidatus Hydrogenedentota bacterium]HRZ18111.1 hypothetical protein [Candidatus Hydrogenedentota bacterium]